MNAENAQVPTTRQIQPKQPKAPSLKTMEKWLDNGVAKATDGCRVEPDGYCEHSKPSWLIQLGFI